MITDEEIFQKAKIRNNLVLSYFLCCAWCGQTSDEDFYITNETHIGHEGRDELYKAGYRYCRQTNSMGRTFTSVACPTCITDLGLVSVNREEG